MEDAGTAGARPVAAGFSDGLAVWEFAGLMLTYWCSARCTFCYVNAGPHHDAHMSIDHALALWRSLDRLAAAHGKTMRIHLTGGEPFRDWVQLAALLRAAHDAGLTRPEKIETNAFWAVDDGETRARIELLDRLGVERLVVSCDAFHQEFIPLERVRRCVEIARHVLGRERVRVRWWDFYRDPVDIRALGAADRLQVFGTALARHRERLCGRAAVALPQLLPSQPASVFAAANCRSEVLLSRHVHIDPSGHVFPGTCAGIMLGQAGGTPVEELWHKLAARWVEHPALAAVIAGGSFELYRQARALGYIDGPGGYASKCHLCASVRRFFFERGIWPAEIGPRECYDLPPPADTGSPQT